MEKIVEINCLEHIYPDKTRIELCGIAITIRKGEKVAVLGPSGSGKTTMLKHITGLLSPSSGVIKVFGADPAREYNKIRGKNWRCPAKCRRTANWTYGNRGCYVFAAELRVFAPKSP